MFLLQFVVTGGIRVVTVVLVVEAFQAQELLFQTVILRVFVYEVFLDAFDCVSVQLTPGC